MRKYREQDERLAVKLTEAVNAMGYSDEGTSHALMIQHRTLQSNLFRLMMTWVCTIHDAPDYQFDTRNEDVRQFVKDLFDIPGVSDLFDKRGFRFI